jgi:hypothetical protein
VRREFLSRWLGFGNGYELLRKMYFARFGLVPLSTKAERLEGLEEAETYEIQGAPFKGFMVRGRTRQGKRVARIQLLDTTEELDLRLNFSSTEELDDEELGTIVNSVRITDR